MHLILKLILSCTLANTTNKNLMTMTIHLNRQISTLWTILRLTVKKFFQIEGSQLAEAFSYNAFFSLFPLTILLVTFASTFTSWDSAGAIVISYIEGFIPLSGEMQDYIFNTIASVMKTRGQASVVASLILVWVTLQCFSTLIHATNRAWGTEVPNWWRLPLKSLLLLGITADAVLIGISLPMLAQMAKEYFLATNNLGYWIYALGKFFIPLLVMFLSLSMFYKLAPRRPTRFAEVWLAALITTLFLLAAESLFVIYLKNFSTLNAVYGAFGGIMALLLWIYLSGCIFIFGACLSAAQAEEKLPPTESTNQNLKGA